MIVHTALRAIVSCGAAAFMLLISGLFCASFTLLGMGVAGIAWLTLGALIFAPCAAIRAWDDFGD